MAVDLNKFKKKTEKRLPILFLLEENKVAALSADIVMSTLKACLEKNIHTEFMVLSFGLDWTLRYPKLKANAPYFARLEEVDPNDIWHITSNIQESKQTFLGSALDLTKAILDDPETTKSDRYKPIVIIIASRTPAKGWEESLDTLLNEGRSSNAQVYWINNGDSDIDLTHTISQTISALSIVGSPFNETLKVINHRKEKAKPDSPVKTFEKIVYKTVLLGQGTDAANEIVSSFKLEPLDEAPEEDSVEFDVPGFDGDFGDGADAKGDGIV